MDRAADIGGYLREIVEIGAPIGIVFFLWIGVFSLMVIAQFWAYANDVYSPDAGKRLFAVIAFSLAPSAASSRASASPIPPEAPVIQITLFCTAAFCIVMLCAVLCWAMQDIKPASMLL